MEQTIQIHDAEQAQTVSKQPSAPPAPTSYFDGTTLQHIGWQLLGFLFSAITFGLASPWADCMIYSWETKHTVIGGRRLYFDGKGYQLLGKYLLWWLLTLITFGIYALFIPVDYRKWRASHTRLATAEESAKVGKLSSWQIVSIVFSVIAAITVIAILVCMILGSGILANMEPSKIIPNIVENAENLMNSIAAGQSGHAALPGEEGDYTAPGFTVPLGTQDEYSRPLGMYYVTHGTGLNLRHVGNTDGTVLAVIPYRTLVEATDWYEGWALVSYGGVTGWCSGNYLSRNDPGPLPTEPDSTERPTGVYYVIARDGVEMTAADGISEIGVNMPYGAEVGVNAWWGNVADIVYNGIVGYCDGTYLSPIDPNGPPTSQGGSSNNSPDDTKGYTTEEIYQAVRDANALIESYRGKTVSQGYGAMSLDYLLSHYNEACKLTVPREDFYRQFEHSHGVLQASDDPMMGIEYMAVSDSRYQSVADICDHYFSLLADDLAVELLKHCILELDGQLYALRGGRYSDGSDGYIDHREAGEYDGYYAVTLYVTQTLEDGTTVVQPKESHKCIQEDGIWVFQSTEYDP